MSTASILTQPEEFVKMKLSTTQYKDAEQAQERADVLFLTIQRMLERRETETCIAPFRDELTQLKDTYGLSGVAVYHHFLFLPGSPVYVTCGDADPQALAENRVENDEIHAKQLFILTCQGLLTQTQPALLANGQPAKYVEDTPGPDQLQGYLEDLLPQLLTDIEQLPQHIARTGDVSRYKEHLASLKDRLWGVKALQGCLKEHWDRELPQYEALLTTADALTTACDELFSHIALSDEWSVDALVDHVNAMVRAKRTLNASADARNEDADPVKRIGAQKHLLDAMLKEAVLDADFILNQKRGTQIVIGLRGTNGTQTRMSVREVVA